MAAVDVGSSVKKEADDERAHIPRGDLVWKMYRTMITHKKEVVFFLLFIIAVYATLQSGPLITKKAAFPEPFFPLNSVVVDYFWGDVYRAFDRVQYADVTFIMFYAPWDAESMDIRWEFEKTSIYYSNQISFSAVNCWWPNGDCKLHFPKIRSFPLLIAYHSNGKGIAFHGTPTFPYLVKFLEEFLNPIFVVHNQTDVFNLLAKRDAVILGFFNFGESPMPNGFLNYYSASLKALEKDPEHDTAFAVVSNDRDASNFGLHASGSIELHLWNEKLIYNGNGTLSPHKLLNWISFKKSQVLKWVTLPCVKSRRLSAFLEAANPTLIMLTPRFVTSSLERSPYFYMLKEVALEYYDCNTASSVSNVNRGIQNILKSTSFSDNSMIFECNYSHLRECKLGDITSHCCVSVLSEQKLFSVCVVQDQFQPEDTLCRILHKEMHLHESWNFSGCKMKKLTYSSLYYVEICRYKHSSELLRYFSCPELVSSHKCALLDHSDIHPGLILQKERGHTSLRNITSQGCFTNRTLNFVALDSLRYGFLFEKLGVSVSKIDSRTAVAIIHAKQETYYILEKDTTLHNLREFIMNFTQNELQRHRRSTASTAIKNHISSRETMTIVEVTSKTFNNDVIETTQDIVVFVYAPWCASCFGMYHIYLSVARYFQASSNIIFTRINGDANDLPWEFTVQKYPTVILFPGHRKSESESFPADMPMTTKNLIHFVLANTQEKVRLHSVFALCSNICVEHNKQLATNKISKLLSEYREIHKKLGQNVKAIEMQCANSTGPETISAYFENAKYLAEQLCEVRTKLANAKVLHLKLSTNENQRMTPEHIDDVIDSNAEPECDNFGRNLKKEVELCPRHLKSHLVFGQNSL